MAVVDEVSPADAEVVAEEAGLRYVTDAEPGIRRVRRGKGFSYRSDDGRPVTAAAKERIKALVIPPAWSDVWICAQANGHLQATGRDAKGRKQYRYHDTWREVRDADKFSRLKDFGERLSDLREQVEADLTGSGTQHDKVVAAVVRLLDDTLIRVGNEEYADTNESFGLTTLRPEHVEELSGSRFTLRFVGKSGVEHDVTVEDTRLAKLVRRCHELEGHDLFSYRTDDDRVRSVSSGDVNEYLHRTIGPDMSAKVFRTWGATSLVAATLAQAEDDPADVEKEIVAAIDEAAEQLRNTRAVCRQSYVHPVVLDAFRDGGLKETWRHCRAAGRLSRADHTVLIVLQDRT